MGQLKYHNGTAWVYLDLPDQNNASLFTEVALVGTIDGTNKVFTSPIPFATIAVYKNGLRMRAGASNDYVVTNSTTITFNTAPAVTTPVTTITADMTSRSTVNVSGSNSFVFHEVPAGLTNGTNTSYTTATGYVGGSLQVFRNGIREKGIVEVSPSAGTFTTDLAPTSTDNWEVAYQFSVGTTGNADTVDGFHASQTLTANTIPVLDSSGKLPLTLKENPWMRATNTGRPSMSLSSYALSIVDLNASFDGGGGSSYLTFNSSTDRITIGSGVSKVKISAQVGSLGGPVTSELDLNIQKNGTTILTAFGAKRATNDLLTLTLPPKVIAVSPGDYFQLGIVAAVTGTYSFFFDNDTSGWLEIEVIG